MWVTAEHIFIDLAQIGMGGINTELGFAGIDVKRYVLVPTDA